MTLLRVCLSLCFVLVSAACNSATLTHGGQQREYDLVIPDGFATPGPVVFVLHGGTRTAAAIKRQTRFHELGAREGFATVYPQGIGRQWNDAREAPNSQYAEDIDDVGFLKALAARLVREGIADARRIYVTGPSNGGMMTFRLACEAADTFAAFAPVIANLPTRAEETCRPHRPVPLLVINGTEDQLVRWQGGRVADMFPGDRGQVLSTEQTVSIFARRISECTTYARKAMDRLTDGSGIQPIHHRHSDCAAGTEVGLYEMQGMGHRWPQSAVVHLAGIIGDLVGPGPRDFPGNQVIWDFLNRFSLP